MPHFCLGGSIMDLLRDGRIQAAWQVETSSRVGRTTPTGLFFTDDVLSNISEGEYEGNYDLKPGSRYPNPGDFIKVPMEFQGLKADAWIAWTKYDSFQPEEKEWLKENLPEYFSDDPNAGLKRGFFAEEFNDKLTEETNTNLTAEQVWEIMQNSQMSQDDKSEKLFGKWRKADYVSLLNFNCFEYTDKLFTNGYLSEKGLELFMDGSLARSVNWVANQIVRGAGDSIRGPFHQKTLFLHTAHRGRLDLNTSWEDYVASRYDSSTDDVTEFQSKGYHWYKYIKYTIEKFEETGWFKPGEEETVRGFFNEKLTESINRNFTTNSQISDIMDNPDLSPDEKARRLFDRHVDYVEKLGKFGYYDCVPDDIRYELFGKFSEMREEYIRSNFCNARVNSLLIKGNETEPFTLEESWTYYVKEQPVRRYSEYVRTSCGALIWWKYIKGTIEMWEELLSESKWSDEYLPVKRGFFAESIENKDLQTWWKNNLDIDYDTLEELAYKNYDGEWDSIGEFEIRWFSPEGGSTGIISPWFDSVGYSHFDSLDEMCDYYGEEFVKNWLVEFVNWLRENKLWIESSKIGFFKD